MAVPRRNLRRWGDEVGVASVPRGRPALGWVPGSVLGRPPEGQAGLRGRKIMGAGAETLLLVFAEGPPSALWASGLPCPPRAGRPHGRPTGQMRRTEAVWREVQRASWANGATLTPG